MKRSVTTSVSRSSKPDGGAHRMVRRLLGLGLASAAIALAWFHIGLLWDRLTDLGSLESATALRWLLAAFLILALARLRHLGIPLFWGRRALVLWILVLLLHLQDPYGATQALADAGDGLASEQLLLVLPVSITLAILGRLVYGAELASSHPKNSPHQLNRFFAAWDSRSRYRRAGFSSSLSPRAPPS